MSCWVQQLSTSFALHRFFVLARVEVNNVHFDSCASSCERTMKHSSMFGRTSVPERESVVYSGEITCNSR